MNGELALLATLAGFGGRYLRTTTTSAPPEMLHGNSSFQYVGSFSARMASRGFLKRSATVTSPEEWLEALRSHGVADLFLVTHNSYGGPLPAHVASAFSNSGTWGLLAIAGSARAMWTMTWAVGNRDAADSRIWSVEAHAASGEQWNASEVSVDDAHDRLRAALREIEGFAERTAEVGDWAPWFRKAVHLLDDPAPTAPYHQDILPHDADLGRRQLAAAVVQAWVFGGMGSWNDGGCADPETQREYERVGANLYAALLTALPAAVNGG